MSLLRRTTVRAIVVDHAYRVLLLHLTDGARSWWEPPTLHDLHENGLAVRLGPCVWVRERRRHTERFHVAWLDDPSAPRAQVTERKRVLGEHWWTLDELAESPETFDPASLPSLAPALVRGEYGDRPLVLA